MSHRGLKMNESWTGNAKEFAENRVRSMIGSEPLLPKGAVFPPLEQTSWASSAGGPKRPERVSVLNNVVSVLRNLFAPAVKS